MDEEELIPPSSQKETIFGDGSCQKIIVEVFFTINILRVKGVFVNKVYMYVFQNSHVKMDRK